MKKHDNHQCRQTPIDTEFNLAEDDPLQDSQDVESRFAESKFEETGFTGGVNYYRAFDINWELSAPWTGSQVKVPTKFIVGEFDLAYHHPGIQDFVHKGGFKRFVPLLQEVVVVEGAAHFVNQERPDEISEHIYAFLRQH